MSESTRPAARPQRQPAPPDDDWTITVGPGPAPGPELEIHALLGRLDALLRAARRWNRRHPDDCRCEWCRTDGDAWVIRFDLAGLVWALVNVEASLSCVIRPCARGAALRRRHGRPARRRRGADAPAVVPASVGGPQS